MTASTPPPSSTPSGVVRTSAALLPLVLIGRGAGFIVSAAIASWFGVGAATDAWYWALALPTVALVVTSSAAATAITPHLARLRVESPEAEGRLIGGAVVWAALVAVLMCLPLCVAGPWAIERVTRFQGEALHLAARFLWETLPAVAFMAAGAVLRAACEVRGRFRWVTLAPALRALAMLGTLVLFEGMLGAHTLPWALAVGEGLHVFLLVAVLRSMAIPLRWSFEVGAPLRALASDLSLLLGGETLVALHLLVDKVCAGLLSEGSVATLEFASRARVIPQTLLEGSLVMVAFSTWSRLRAEGRHEDARRQIDESLRWTATLAAPVLAGMFVGRFVLVHVLFERGAFGPDDAAATAGMLAWYVPGLFMNLLAILAMKAHVVEGNLRLVARLGAVSLALKAALNLTAFVGLGVDGLALSATVTSAVVGLCYLWKLREQLDLRAWGPTFASVAASALVVASVESRGAPRSLGDPTFWAAAGMLVFLLSMGAGVLRKRLYQSPRDG